MVLHKNKWDLKAKYAYLKKHGLVAPKPQEEVRPKWSLKKTLKNRAIVWDSDLEWDSDDDALVRHFYPELAERDLPLSVKKTLKQQIKQSIEETEAPKPKRDESDGIYLGTRPEPEEEVIDMGEFVLPKEELQAKLADYLNSDLVTKRKVLKSKISDNLLEEYGLESYASTVKDTDYSELKKEVNLSKLSLEEIEAAWLDKPDSTIRSLTEEEKQEHNDRLQKRERQQFLNQIKSKFGLESKNKVLEVNNFNSRDQQQMDVLNKRLLQSAPQQLSTLDDDLKELIGLDTSAEPAPEAQQDFLEELLG